MLQQVSYILWMLFGIFVLVYSILGISRKNTPAEINVPKLGTLKTPVWFFGALLGVAMIGSPILIGAFKPSPPPPIPTPAVEYTEIWGEVNHDGVTSWKEVDWSDLEFSASSPLYMEREYQQSGTFLLKWVLKVPTTEALTGGSTFMLSTRGADGQRKILIDEFVPFSQIYDKNDPYRWVRFDIQRKDSVSYGLKIMPKV